MEMDDKRKSGFPNLLSRPKGEEGGVDHELSQHRDGETKKIPVGREARGRSSRETEPEVAGTNPGLGTRREESSLGRIAEGEVSNLVSADLTEKDKRDIYEAIDVIRRKMSFARDFTDDEKANMMRLGKAGRNFVEKAQDLVERAPGILPRSFDVDEFKRDADLYQELGNMADELRKLTERVSDTEAAVGSDAFSASLIVYQSGKLARTGDDMDNQLTGWRRNREDI